MVMIMPLKVSKGEYDQFHYQRKMEPNSELQTEKWVIRLEFYAIWNSMLKRKSILFFWITK